MASIQIGGNASAIPSDATLNGQVGDIVWNNTPSANSPMAWVCTVAGYPGTWLPVGVVNSLASSTTTATSGTLSSTYSMILLNAASGPTFSLPNVTAYPAGASLFIKQIANNSATLAPLAANGYDAAAITLTQYQAVTLRSAGGTTWYKQA